MKTTIISFTKSISLIIGALVLAVAISQVQAAWTEPSSGTVPPNNNTQTPINVGLTDQLKLGSIISDKNISASSFCLLNSNYSGTTGCIDKWPSGGGSSISSCSVKSSDFVAGGQTVVASCSATEFATGGGCKSSGSNLYENEGYPVAGGYSCRSGNGDRKIQAIVVCCK